MRGKTVLITGGTGGIGFETARSLARRGAELLLVGRDGARGEGAAARLRSETGNLAVSAFAADVSLRADLRRLVHEVADRVGLLDVLINNAGVNRARRELTSDGVEADFATNVLAPFILGHELRPLLRRSSRARIVNLTGGIPRGPIDIDNLQGEKSFVGLTFCQYNHTKLAMMAMSLTLARRLAGEGISVNVAYPGHAYTPGNRATGASAFPVLYRPVAPVLRVLGPVFMGAKAIAKASRSSVFLASSSDVDGVTGAYYDKNCRRADWPDSVVDPANQDAVWALCAQLGNVTNAT